MSKYIRYEGTVRRGIVFSPYKSARRVSLIPTHSYALTDSEALDAESEAGKRFYHNLSKLGLILITEQSSESEGAPADKDINLSGGEVNSEVVPTEESESEVVSTEEIDSEVVLDKDSISDEDLVNDLDSKLSDEDVDAMISDLGLSTKKRSKRTKLEDIVPANKTAVLEYTTK